MWLGVLFLLSSYLLISVKWVLTFDADSFFEVVPFLMAHYLVKFLTVIWHFTYGIIYGMSFFQNDFLRTQNTNQDHEKSCMYDPLNNGS